MLVYYDTLFNDMIAYYFLHRASASFSAQDGLALRMSQECAVNVTLVRRSPDSFTLEVGQCVRTKVGNCRKGKDGLVVKAGESYTGERGSISTTAIAPWWG